jgi:SAM-dependent methyltransferase
MTIDDGRLGEFVRRFIVDLGATLAAGSVVVGDRLGLYRALSEGPATPDELAQRTRTDPRYLTEWLSGQAAGGYVEYDADTGEFSMTEEQTFALVDPDGVGVPAAFQLALGALKAEPRIAENFRTGAGYGWHEQSADVHIGCERFLRPRYVASLVPDWIPALDGVQAKLERGAKIADVGCGGGSAAVLIAAHFPNSVIHASDYLAGSVDIARKNAADAGVGDRVHVSVASAQTFKGRGFDLVTTFDCLHDMGDPLGAAKHIRQSLARDGTWLIVEPTAGESLADNLHPVGRLFYGFSTLLCVPSALSQPGGYALGAQAGESAIRQIVTDGGFTRFRRVAQTPFNLVFEARR